LQIFSFAGAFRHLSALACENSRILGSEQVFDLEAALRKNADDFADIEDTLHSVMEEFGADHSMEEWDHLQSFVMACSSAD
jgi:hypothetical protein